MASNSERPVQVRAALASDLDRILEIEVCSPHRSSLVSSRTTQSALTATSPRRLLLIAESTRKLKGSSRLVPCLLRNGRLKMSWLRTRRRRIGIRFPLWLVFGTDKASTNGPNDQLVVYLEVRESNVAAAKLYEKFGFRLDNRRRAFTAFPREDALVYRYTFQ